MYLGNQQKNAFQFSYLQLVLLFQGQNPLKKYSQVRWPTYLLSNKREVVRWSNKSRRIGVDSFGRVGYSILPLWASFQQVWWDMELNDLRHWPRFEQHWTTTDWTMLLLATKACKNMFLDKCTLNLGCAR